mgnify:CR=1 FL=1
MKKSTSKTDVLQNLSAFIHDGNAKIAIYWENVDDDLPDITELHDPGHMKKKLLKGVWIRIILTEKYLVGKRSYSSIFIYLHANI